MKKILVIQTAFAGDLVLTLPLIQRASEFFAPCAVDLLCIPSTAALVRNHPAVRSLHVYDKRNDRFALHLCTSLRARLAAERYDIVLSPHRSLRSALIARLCGAGTRVAFDTAAGSFFYTHLVEYGRGKHEIERVLSLLRPFGGEDDPAPHPALYPHSPERDAVDAIISTYGIRMPCLCIAPGSVWRTKRWLPERFAGLARAFTLDDYDVVLVGGEGDRQLCAEIADGVKSDRCFVAAGMLDLLQTAELISRSALLVSNDSAPVHLASAMGIPVVDIYGATIPGFGFSPYDVAHRIIQREGLACRPCGIHGGNRCPIKTFECMTSIGWEEVYAAAKELLRGE